MYTSQSHNAQLISHCNDVKMCFGFGRYERFLKIMILSVLKNTHRPVKFWFIKNYLSPQFKVVFITFVLITRIFLLNWIV